MFYVSDAWDNFPTFPSYPHVPSLAASSATSLPELFITAMPKNPFRAKSEEHLAPKPHGRTSDSARQAQGSDETSSIVKIRRSSSSQLPKNIVRLSHVLEKPIASFGLGKETPHSKGSRPVTERIEEEQSIVIEESQDQISALPQMDSSIPETSTSTGPSFSAIRHSFRDPRRPISRGALKLAKTLASSEQVGNSRVGLNRGFKKETRGDVVASASGMILLNDDRAASHNLHLISPKKGAKGDFRVLGKIHRPKTPRAGIKELFTRAEDRGDGNDDSMGSPFYERLWPSGKHSPRKRASTYHGHQASKIPKENNDSDYWTASEGIKSGAKVAEHLVLPDIPSQTTLEEDIKIDILRLSAESGSRSASSTKLSDMSDQAQAASESSQDASIDESRPIPVNFSRSRSRHVRRRGSTIDISREDLTLAIPLLRDPFNEETPMLETERAKKTNSNPSGVNLEDSFHGRTWTPTPDIIKKASNRSISQKHDHLSPLETPSNVRLAKKTSSRWTSHDLEDPFLAETPTSNELTKKTTNETAIQTPTTAVTSASPTSQPEKHHLETPSNDANDCELWLAIQRELRAPSPEPDDSRYNAPTKRPEQPPTKALKRWKNAHRNYFGAWAVGVPQDVVVQCVQRDLGVMDGEH